MNHVKQYKTVLSIAGSDSSGGAGIQADIKTVSACGAYAMTAVTAITIQNTCGVEGVEVVPADAVARQIDVVARDIAVDAVKLGMLPAAGTVAGVAAMLRRHRIPNIVTDPVMIATSGDRLVDDDAAQAIVATIFPLSALVTPNIAEAEFISGLSIRSESDFDAAAEKILATGAQSVLLKAGHLPGNRLTDRLYQVADGRIACRTYTYERIDTPNTHGTGCTLSSAIATYLALGYLLPEAVQLAEDYLHKAILTGAAYKTGQGHGPVHHFFRFWE